MHHLATMHSVKRPMNGQTDRWHYDANSYHTASSTNGWSYCMQHDWPENLIIH